MGKFRLFIFIVLVFVNALLCFLYVQPKRSPLSSYSLNVTRVEDIPEVNSTPSLPAGVTVTPETNNQQNMTVKPAPEPPGMPLMSHPFQYLINREDFCLRTGVKRFPLLISVCSAVHNFKQRQAIRDTWGSASSRTGNTGSVRIVFLLGASDNPNITRLVVEESAEHKDIVQESFTDSYQNLTLKSVMMLKWVSKFCPNAQFLLKTDDDMYINVPNLVRTVARLNNKKNMMFGVLFRKASPERNASAKWFVPKSQYPGQVFPDYLSGTGYVMTGDVIEKLYNVSLTKPFLIMEDVFVTGICASAANVKRFSVKGFSHFRRPSTGCAFKELISGHHVSVAEMHKIWRELQNGTQQCKVKRIVRRRQRG